MSWWRDKYGVIAGLTTLSLVADQVSKAAIIAHFPQGGSLPLIPGFCELFHTHNYAAAFGLFGGKGAWFFLIVSTLAIGFIGFYFYRLRRDDVWLATALALILGGALGNMIDRLRHGFVIDFIRFYLGNLSWPTFNLADISIVCGVAMFAIDMMRSEKQARGAANGAADQPRTPPAQGTR
jgi:signal peptidase II